MEDNSLRYLERRTINSKIWKRRFKVLVSCVIQQALVTLHLLSLSRLPTEYYVDCSGINASVKNPETKMATPKK